MRFPWSKKSSPTPAPAVPVVAASVTVAVVAPRDLDQAGLPVYPPLDSGVALAPTHEILASQAELLRTLRRHVSLPESEFRRRYLEPIERLAAFVGLLPASRTSFHTGAGGLFRFCLEMGVYAARAADGVMFAPSESVERKRIVEAAWRHGAFLTALCAELYRPLTEMQVVSSEGETWSPYLGPLTPWAEAHRVERVFIRWNNRKAEPAGARASAAWALNAIAGDALLASLHSVTPRIVEAMVGAVTGTLTALDDHPLTRVLGQVRQGVIESDEAIQPRLYGMLTQGAHLEPVLLDAIRTLVTEGKWQINKKGARLHYGRDGLYLAWPIAAGELSEFLASRDIKGVPSNPTTLAESMLSGGVVAAGKDGLPWHMIYPVVGEKSAPNPILAIRFTRPASLLSPEMPQAPVTWDLQKGSQPEPPASIAAPLQEANRVDEEKPDDGSAPSSAPPQALGSDPQPPAAVAAGFTPPPRPAGSAERAAEPATVAVAASGGQAEAGGKVGGGGKRGSRSKAPEHGDQVVEAVTDMATLAPEILAAIGLPLARELVRWRDAWNRGLASDSFVETAEGLGVKLSFVTSTSMLEVNRIVEPLKQNSWLVMKEDSGRARPLHMLNFPNAEERGYILKKAFVKRLGFMLAQERA